MGLRITNSADSVAFLRTQETTQTRRAIERSDEDRPVNPFRRESMESAAKPPERVTSVPQAAATTLKRGLREARGIVPSIEEAQQGIRSRFEQARDQLFASRSEPSKSQPLDPQELNRSFAETAGQTRDFINRLDRQAAITNARLNNEPEPAAGRRATLTVNGERFTFQPQPPVSEVFGKNIDFSV